MHEVDDEGLAEAFFSVSRRLRHRTREALQPWELSPSLGRAISALTRHGDMRPGALAEHLRIAPRTATEVADDLQRLGLAERHPDPADRRAVIVTLTEEGRRVSREINAARRDAGERFFATLSPADRAELSRLLRELREGND
ncbi:MarR family transcriptional regulator [Paractinoplanes abujensis]|uniref:DNA-binding MarR family transcriptional regulator n=1 Tax=Paractinoplanes abujensis TaxID=882441 RepID=A0A7W7CR84_9ACTN|nr:MarR family winged helix-turn-helix transcriptional regulator [Actinoplanes abujensis]MBB4691476.1 DNA-binding MarR family transcriptional regulator [Actinoplanes abujensis]GID17109.1 MarR family transcriptional regulator [Actinoplanes abujensis]